jgi:ParB-like chromosome segregation protein Spo0J
MTTPRIRTTRYSVEPVENLHPHPRNVNESDVGAITESMDELGFYGAVLVQEGTNTILAGKHRWETAKAEGMTEVPVLWTDFDDDETIRGMLSDNRTARLGRDHADALAELLADLSQTPRQTAGTGYSGDDLDALISSLNSESAQAPLLVKEGHAEYRCPQCGHEWSGSPTPGLPE